MRWSPLARKECRAVATSKGVWLLAVALVLWGYRPSYVGWDGLGANITAGYVQVAGTVLLPLGVLLLSYQSIVGERTSGSVKFVLGLPQVQLEISHDRRSTARCKTLPGGSGFPSQSTPRDPAGPDAAG